jgi:PLP dependent protein
MSVSFNLKSLISALPPECKLVAVTKTHSPDTILEAYNAGHRAFGENKVQELVSKHETLPKDIEWHLIGHLQTNKVKYIAGFVALIHSVDSLKLLEEINQQGKKIGRKVPCLLQIHIASEETKFGLSEEEVTGLLSSPDFKTLEFVIIKGLMGMATLTSDAERIRNEFRRLRSLFERLKIMKLPESVKLTELSMGMSSDYMIAVEEGSTMVRVGSAIFGQRDYQKVK